MAPEELLSWLVDLAREAGLELRTVAGGASEEFPTHSGTCRLRDGVFVVLVRSDPVGDRIDAVARALREHRPRAFDGRYLPPAVRERLEGGSSAVRAESRRRDSVDRPAGVPLPSRAEGNRVGRSPSNEAPPGPRPGSEDDA